MAVKLQRMGLRRQARRSIQRRRVLSYFLRIFPIKDNYDTLDS